MLLLAGILFSGCRKEPARWDVDLTGPLVRTTFTISDLVPDSLLLTGENGHITLLYKDELFALRVDTVIQQPDTSLVYGYVLPVPGELFLPPGVVPFNQNDVTQFDLGDVALRTLIIREGYLDLRLKNMVNSTVFGTFALPGATLPGGPAVLQSPVGPGTPAQPAISEQTLDLAGAHFDLRGPDLDQVNTLSTMLSAQLDPNGEGATVTNQDSIIAIATYRDLVPEYARGYFGSRVVDIGPDSVELGLFDRIVGGTLDLDQVTMRLKVENGVGVDIQAYIQEFRAVNTRTGANVDLAHTIMQGPVNIIRALESGGSFQPSYHHIQMDNADSNVDQFIESLPDRLNYQIGLHLNPLGDISNGHDFLYYNSRIRAELEVEVPLSIIANDLTLESIVAPSLPGTVESHALQNGELRLFAVNGFPFSASMEIDIITADGALLSNVPVQGTIAAGILGTDLLVQSLVDSRLDAHLTSEQVDMLYQGGRFRIRTIFNTTAQSQHVRILDSYKLDLRIAAGAHYLVNGNE